MSDGYGLRKGPLGVKSGIQGETWFASGPTPIADIANAFIGRCDTTPPPCPLYQLLA
jgi:hypothetical protein